MIKPLHKSQTSDIYMKEKSKQIKQTYEPSPLRIWYIYDMQKRSTDEKLGTVQHGEA
jgi:hypothetical protein